MPAAPGIQERRLADYVEDNVRNAPGDVARIFSSTFMAGPRGVSMARAPNYSQDKKRREEAARKKRDEKQQRRQQKKDTPAAPTS